MQKIFLLIFALNSSYCLDNSSTINTAPTLTILTQLALPSYRPAIKQAMEQLSDSTDVRDQAVLGILKEIAASQDVAYLQLKCRSLELNALLEKFKKPKSDQSSLIYIGCALAGTAAVAVSKLVGRHEDQPRFEVPESATHIAASALLIGAGLGGVAFGLKRLKDVFTDEIETKLQKAKDEQTKVKIELDAVQVTLKKMETNNQLLQDKVNQALLMLKDMLPLAQKILAAGAQSKRSITTPEEATTAQEGMGQEIELPEEVAASPKISPARRSRIKTLENPDALIFSPYNNTDRALIESSAHNQGDI